MKRFYILPFLAPSMDISEPDTERRTDMKAPCRDWNIQIDDTPITGKPYVPSPEAEKRAELYIAARWKYLYVDEHVTVSTQPMWWGHAHVENNVFTCASENVMQYFIDETGEPTGIKVEPCR